MLDQEGQCPEQTPVLDRKLSGRRSQELLIGQRLQAANKGRRYTSPKGKKFADGRVGRNILNALGRGNLRVGMGEHNSSVSAMKIRPSKQMNRNEDHRIRPAATTREASSSGTLTRQFLNSSVFNWTMVWRGTMAGFIGSSGEESLSELE